MRYMLDTNICISIIKDRPPEVMKSLRRVPVGEIGVSGIVVAELWYGVFKSTKKKENSAAIEDFLRYVAVMDWPSSAAVEYGKIRFHLQKKGLMIGAMDLLIAAHAVTLDSVLVTDNVSEFKRVPRLKVENWIKR